MKTFAKGGNSHEHCNRNAQLETGSAIICQLTISKSHSRTGSRSLWNSITLGFRISTTSLLSC